VDVLWSEALDGMASVAIGNEAGVVAPLEVQPNSDISVEVIAGYQEFLDFEEQWDRVVDTSGVDHPFLEHAWLRTWWECFGTGCRLHIIVAKVGSRAIGIAPLVLTRARMWGVPLRKLMFFYNNHVPRADFLVAGRRAEVYKAIWEHLAQSRCWDLLQLCQLPEGSETFEAVARLARTAGRPVGIWESSESPFIPLPGSSRHPTWSEYFDGLSAKHRSNLRNRLKRLRAQGPVGMETIDSEQRLAQALEDGLRIEAAAWKGAAGTAISSRPALTRFYELLARRAAERGWLRLHFLNAGRDRIAFDYSLCYRNRMYLLKLGYEPAYSPLSPSNLLLQFAMESSFEEGLDEYDFLGDAMDWKRCWTSLTRTHRWLYVFGDSFKARLAHAAKFHLAPLLKQNACVRTLLERLGSGRD
jgi:CelD/BcsL family acetyltransferase involved in cellulose biosynthesis